MSGNKGFFHKCNMPVHIYLHINTGGRGQPRRLEAVEKVMCGNNGFFTHTHICNTSIYTRLYTFTHKYQRGGGSRVDFKAVTELMRGNEGFFTHTHVRDMSTCIFRYIFTHKYRGGGGSRVCFEAVEKFMCGNESFLQTGLLRVHFHELIPGFGAVVGCRCRA